MAILWRVKNTLKKKYFWSSCGQKYFWPSCGQKWFWPFRCQKKNTGPPTKYQITSSRKSLVQSHLKSRTIRGSRHKLWNCAIWHCSTVSLRNSLDFRSTLDTEVAYSEASRLVTIDTTKATMVVYMSSKILQLTVESWDVSQLRKNDCCYKLSNSKNGNFFHPGSFWMNFVNLLSLEQQSFFLSLR